MKFKIFLIFTILFSSGTILAQNKKNIRKASSARSIKKNTSKPTGRNNTKSNKSTTSSIETIETIQTITQTEIHSGNCDSYYTRCMNKICSSDELGKCACYEDRTMNNLTPTFIDINGMKMKQGFETFEYAKKQCVYILDQCMDQRRGITEKYKNLVQRDCLMLTQQKTEQPQGISGDLENLKSCIRDYCTPFTMEGYENFSSPEYSLCFNETYSNFAMDVYCSNIIAKSSSPLTVKQLFLDEMALKREKSCIAMKGTLSNDRKTCYVEIKYGTNKENIKKSKKIPVGSYFECSAKTFDAKKNETKETRQKKFNQILSLTATGINAAGTVLSDIGGVTDPIGRLIDTGIDITETAVDLSVGAAKAAKSLKKSIDNEDTFATTESFSNLVTTTTSMYINASNAVDAVKTGTAAIKSTSAAASATSNAADAVGAAGGGGGAKALKVLNYAAIGVTAAAQITDVAMTNKADKIQMEEEEKGIAAYSNIDREAGFGEVYDTLTERGNCFLNNEWFASENENIIIQWKY